MRKKLKTVEKVVFVSVLMLSVVLISSHQVKGARIRAGVAKVNITRDIPTSPVNDPLFARALVLDDGQTKAVVVSLDIINISLDALSQIRMRVQNELKIDGSNVLINASHNHWVNDQLAEDYMDRVFKAIKVASQSMVAVSVGSGAGTEKRITMNRRITLTNGKEWTIRRATPEPQDESVDGIAEAFDPEIGILRLDKKNGKPLALLYTFACHNYTGVPNRGATAGFPGFASKVIEDNLGDKAVALFLQGAAGDITPILYKDVNAPKQDEIHGTLLGLSTLSAYRGIKVNKDVSVSILREELVLPVRKDVQDHVDSLEARKAMILDYFKGQGCGAHGAGTKLNFKSFLPLYIRYMMAPEYPSDYSYRYMQEEKIGIDDLVMMDEDNKRDMEKYLNCIYKMEELLVTEANLGYLKNIHTETPVKAEVMGLKVGDFVLIAFAGEVFAKIGLNIKELSPYDHTFVTGYTNGSVGYAPTSDAYDGDAYEISHARLAPEWQKIFEHKALEIIGKL
jgi:hypothetical protein